jgi:hypothetical protein
MKAPSEAEAPLQVNVTWFPDAVPADHDPTEGSSKAFEESRTSVYSPSATLGATGFDFTPANAIETKAMDKAKAPTAETARRSLTAPAFISTSPRD